MAGDKVVLSLAETIFATAKTISATHFSLINIEKARFEPGLLFYCSRSAISVSPRGFAFLTCILSIVLIVWLLTNVDFTKEGYPILVAAVVGLIFYGAYRIFSKRDGPTPSET